MCSRITKHYNNNKKVLTEFVVTVMPVDNLFLPVCLRFQLRFRHEVIWFRHD